MGTDRAAYVKARSDSFRKRGLCLTCGGWKDAGHATCQACRDKMNTWRARRTTCLDCSAPPAFGGKRCEKHLKQIRELNRGRLGNEEWTPGGKGRPPLEAQYTAANRRV